MTAADVDPWAQPDYRTRVALAESILGHATPTDEATRVAIQRAIAALRGASIDEIREATSI